MEAAVRFSQNSLPGQEDQHFLKIDIAGRSLQLYNIQRFKRHSIKYELTHSSKKLNPFRAFDWHPTTATLVAVGHSGGEAGLVNLAYPDQKPVSFNARNPRSCNAVALNSTDWIAIGLDKARSDYGLYIWDINHYVSHSGNKNYKNTNQPIHRVATGESVTSLRFFQDHTQLLATGVQGFVRLYDLREASPSSALQFATRCVNNITVDAQDENYFASCLQTNTPTVAVWDRRMITRTDAPTHYGFATPVSQSEQQPEVSAELSNVADSDSHIFGLRFSKTHRGHLGVLSNTGQLKVITFHKVDSSQHDQQDQRNPSAFDWVKQKPQDIHVDNVQNMSGRTKARAEHEDDRLISFDFTTATSRSGLPTILTLNKSGDISLRPALASDSHALPSPAITLERYCLYNQMSSENGDTKGGESGPKYGQAAANSNKKALETIASLKIPRERCLEGYLLDATKNCAIVRDDDKVLALWKWLEHAKAISANGVLVEGEVDLAYAGACDLWMEEIDMQARAVRSSFTIENPQVSSIIRDTARRLGLIRGKGCWTEYLQHRALCLHALGLPWLRGDIQRECDRLLANKELTKAAAIALFAGEEKIAQKALRAEGSGNGHKMLAMALVSSRSRVHNAKKQSQSSRSGDEESDSSQDSQDEEWQDIIAAISADLTDCYAKSILALVKTNSWEDVISQDCLPLVYRVHVALRHANDTNLTTLLPKLRNQAIASGDLEGIVLTGLGSPASINLLTRYTKHFGDLQTSALAMSYDAVFDRFLLPESASLRTIHCYREAYKSLLMSYTLKFDKTRFVIALSRALRSHNLTSHPRKKEQIRLICSHCNQSLSQFGHDQQIDNHNPSITTLTATTPSLVETAKHPLSSASKAAVTGTICPKCARHLPRCGVCDMWLGTPDETFSKWYRTAPPSQTAGLTSHRNSNTTNKTAERDVDGPPSMIGSTVTTIGPFPGAGTGTPIINLPTSTSTSGPRAGSATGTNRGSSSGSRNAKFIPKNLTTADLAPHAVEVVDEEEIARQVRERRWLEAMRRFTVYCTRCSHGFHAEHARMWFDGDAGEGGVGREGHRVCPVAGCECSCNA